ncbi:uncharacterized protein LOC116268318 [Nymphaea colorata]|uniref:uncharacterized protein LOC116268318 n=1 Tax=Nymphaea colorata TaxID=210225 RepID=UPI00129D2B23|nr:uncharacterized protein LOC116268318 [Nymphaea colorata]
MEFQADHRRVHVKQVKIIEAASNPKLLLSFLNNGLQNIMRRLDYTEIGRTGRYFNCNGERQQMDNLYLYSGFKANFVHLEAGYFLRVDSVKKVVRTETVLEYIDSFYRMYEGKDRDEKRMALKESLIGTIVMTNYGKMQYYKVKNVLFIKGEEVMLDENLSMTKYYYDKYKVEIHKPTQPLLEVEPKRRYNQGLVLLFPEVCLMTGIPSSFDELRRKKISECSIRNPEDKVSEIQSLMDKLKPTEGINVLQQLGMDVNPNMSKLIGRVISVPRLQLGGNNSVESGKEAGFNLHSKPIYQYKHKVCLAVIYFHGTKLDELLETFRNTSKALGIEMRMKTFQLATRSLKDMERQMKEALSGNFGGNICLLILPANWKSDYKKLKKYAIEQVGILTQVMTDLTLRRRSLMSIATKVLLQIVAKRGNTLWVP